LNVVFCVRSHDDDDDDDDDDDRPTDRPTDHATPPTIAVKELVAFL
jgi:hypothetical protein